MQVQRVSKDALKHCCAWFCGMLHRQSQLFLEENQMKRRAVYLLRFGAVVFTLASMASGQASASIDPAPSGGNTVIVVKGDNNHVAGRDSGDGNTSGSGHTLSSPAPASTQFTVTNSTGLDLTLNSWDGPLTPVSGGNDLPDKGQMTWQYTIDFSNPQNPGHLYFYVKPDGSDQVTVSYNTFGGGCSGSPTVTCSGGDPNVVLTLG
ncbi:hypothetical protein [Streptomyces sp. NPDC086023]|uniref:hypothetical protein n=1 Tax=Streptomyces sp. NPDC086023 TaxID=3365746 RepID=UPI0037D89530